MTDTEGSAELLRGRRILVGVTGGIAAYKTCSLVSRLVQDGAQVRVMMTPAAARFVGPVTFRALTGCPAAVDMWEDLPESGEHIALARFAEAVVVAPATANTLAKLAAGICDNLVTTTLLATEAPIILAPAMNTVMWQNPVTQENMRRLGERGYHFVMPESGRLACGDEGAGRMAEPDTLRQALLAVLAPAASGVLAGRQVLITAGPTREWLDPVRFLSNPSSGKMGVALAEAAATRGARVRLVLGPTVLPVPAGVETVTVETAAEMRGAVLERLPGTEVFIGAAAVADYQPERVAEHKLKKSPEALEMRLVPTPDIIREVAAHSQRPAVVVGFAAETEDLEAHAREKLERKGLDLIVANDLSRPGAGFAVNTNEVRLIDREGASLPVSLRAKRAVAEAILDQVERLLT